MCSRRFDIRYRVEYADGRGCSIANNRDEILKLLKKLHNSLISNVRKNYKNGIIDSVLTGNKIYFPKVGNTFPTFGNLLILIQN